ncbi:MAG: ATP-dependent RNA helicase DbpA [Pseudomonadales bacterium]
MTDPASTRPAAGPGFDRIDLAPALLESLAELGLTHMTPVQEATLPPVLAGRDVIARARTGSGKTAAFGLGLLQRIDPASFRVQALVLCPTRELAEQVAREIRRLAKRLGNIKVLTLCGGTPIGPQIGSLQHSAHVVVGTPGRVLKHLRKETLRLRGLEVLVLDEADRMLDMGFAEEIDELLGHVPERRQTLLFSATYPPRMEAISARVQRDPVTIDVTDDEPPIDVSHVWCAVGRDDRDEALVAVLQAWSGALNLVFCNTRIDCARIAGVLQARGIPALALHGDQDQAERNRTLIRFANHSAKVLVATDVAARGLDVDDVDAVFNYQLPTQPEVYLHRSGRTGRAGRRGLAVSLVGERERPRLAVIEQDTTCGAIERRPLPDAARTNAMQSTCTTLEISGGRRNKLRPGDLLGALTAAGGVPGDAVGRIDLLDESSYVAMANAHVHKALAILNRKRIKGRQFRARVLPVQ